MSSFPSLSTFCINPIFIFILLSFSVGFRKLELNPEKMLLVQSAMYPISLAELVKCYNPNTGVISFPFLLNFFYLNLIKTGIFNYGTNAF